MGQQAAMVPSSGERSLELAIALWLEEKLQRSGSERTRRAYADTMTDFRRFLHRAGLELDGATDVISDAAQAWLAQIPPSGKPLSPASRNVKLAILSSFYTFARRRRHLPGIENPIELVGRSRVESYAAAVPIERENMRRRLEAIDRSTPSGLRDYALILLGVTTGRRLAELANLEWQDVKFNGAPEHPKVTVTFRRAKGGKEMHDTLSQPATAALMAYRDACQADGAYGDDRPVWISYSNNGPGHQLHPRTISKLCLRYLDTGKVHAMRHTFAHDMEKVVAPVSAIQQRLGHTSIATTSRYLQALVSDENPYADDLAALYT
jgi:integrase/recombinase XerD